MSSYNKDGLHYTYCQLFSAAEALDYFNRLEKEIPYLGGEFAKIKLYGKSVPIPRQHAAFGDEHLKYTFSGLTLHPKPWTPLLLEIKHAVETLCGTHFNFVLVNKYRNGHDCIGYHKDDEMDLEPESSIASVSLGQKRDFVFKRNGFKSVNLSLESGSLLQMLPPTNSFWSHSLPRSKHAPHVRLNLTFRTMKSSGESLSVHHQPPRLQGRQRHVITSSLSTDNDSNINSCLPEPSTSFPSSTELLSPPLSVANSASGFKSSTDPSFVMKRSAASNSTSTKRMCASPTSNSLILPQDSASDTSPKRMCTSSVTPAPDAGLTIKPAVGISLGNLPPHHFSLGGNKLAKVVEFGSNIKVHIRSYHFDGQFLHPTKYGITMSPLTFIRFKKQSHRYSMSNAIHEINRELSVDCSSSPDDSTYCFQKYYFRETGIRQLSATYVSLNREQFQVLIELCDQIWESITQLLFGEIFQRTVLRLKDIVLDTQRTKDVNREEELMPILIRVMQELIQENIQHVFTCPECNLPYDMMPLNQLGHTCMFYTAEETFGIYFDEAVAFLDPKTVAKTFVKECGELSSVIDKEFLTTFDVKNLLESVLDMPPHDE